MVPDCWWLILTATWLAIVWLTILLGKLESDWFRSGSGFSWCLELLFPLPGQSRLGDFFSLLSFGGVLLIQKSPSLTTWSLSGVLDAYVDAARAPNHAVREVGRAFKCFLGTVAVWGYDSNSRRRATVSPSWRHE